MDTDSLKDLSAQRLSTLRQEETSLRGKYRLYWGFSGFAVGLGIVAPILAGSALLKTLPGASPWWPTAAGLLALAASIFTALHKGLNCEAYQALARKTLMTLRGLILGYEGLAPLPTDDLPPAFTALETRLATFYSDVADVLN
jgi:hypothetical protein